ncbi:RNA-directed DNA polymerase from mobile element jockey-like [Plakobranchus ocellatus]|uniref:RNA-directed DNA polymerase from mobile element jockey-like n=1 Tax=Plakobranchus ocellatus TaxID=259542 RepID=A0AAV4CV65_9GAST|nr:RNA-directed DNA polymerase from mobile element jockey-like [Plakobranchus ocellatus]
MGLSLNVKKTECMVISKKSSNPKCNLFSKGEQIKQVTKFKYLGYLITSGGRCTREISKRIAMAKDTFQKMKPILANGNISTGSNTCNNFVGLTEDRCEWRNMIANVCSRQGTIDGDDDDDDDDDLKNEKEQ